MKLKTAVHRYSNVVEPILIPIEIIIPLNNRVLSRTNPQLYPENSVTGILQPSDLVHEKGDITFCSALVTLNDGNVQIPVNNFTDHPCKLKKDTHIAMTPEQVKSIDAASTWQSGNLAFTTKWPGAGCKSAKLPITSAVSLIRPKLLKAAKTIGFLPQRTPETQTNTLLFRKTSYGNCEPYKSRKHLTTQKMTKMGRISQETWNFDWKDSTLDPDEIPQIEEFILEFHDTLQDTDSSSVWMNKSGRYWHLGTILQPIAKISKPWGRHTCRINHATQIWHNYHYYILKLLKHYWSNFCAERKPKAKFRILVDSRKINNLISNHCLNYNHPVSTHNDAAQHMAGKKRFRKTGLSIYHCLQIADLRSIKR